LRGSEADARLRAADAARSKAARDVATTSQLVNGGALAPNLDKEARDQLAIAEAQASLATEALRYTRLLSPVSGTVQQRFAEPGEAIGPGIAVLLVEEVGRLVVRVGVLQEELAGIVPGSEVSLNPDGLDRSLPGKVSSVAPAPEANDGLFSVEVNPSTVKDLPLVPGALVSVTFRGQKPFPSVKIPNDALVDHNGKQGVFILDGGGDAARATFHAVKIRKLLGKDVWVTEGLAGGERIIAEGAYFIEDGELVRPILRGTDPHG
jgi:RND family efflux transporter MFP subunit